jgi:hypothetical protein
MIRTSPWMICALLKNRCASKQPANPNGTLPFLKGGTLAVIRTAISAMEKLKRG